MTEMVMPTTETGTLRAYWRCGTCLSIYATEVPKPPPVEHARWWRGSLNVPTDVHYLGRYAPICGVCGVATEPMGVVTGSGVLLTKEVQECDGSCQSAQGPYCECKCGGANHGLQWVARTVVLETRGTQPVVSMNDEAARGRATEFKAAYEAALEALKTRFAGIDGLLAKKAEGRWLPADEFDRYLTWTRAMKSLRETKTLKTHVSRMRRLAKLTTG